jgi:hypothetical protein
MFDVDQIIKNQQDFIKSMDNPVIKPDYYDDLIVDIFSNFPLIETDSCKTTTVKGPMDMIADRPCASRPCNIRCNLSGDNIVVEYTMSLLMLILEDMKRLTLTEGNESKFVYYLGMWIPFYNPPGYYPSNRTVIMIQTVTTAHFAKKVVTLQT